MTARAGRGGAPAATALALAALALATPALAEESVSVSLGGGLAMLARRWTTTTSFRSWAGWRDDTRETGQLVSQQTTGSGPTYSLAIGFRISRHLALSLDATRSARDAAADLELSLPHPLLFDRPRSVQGRLADLRYEEDALHVDVEWRQSLGRFELVLSTGPTLLRVRTVAISGVRVRDEYPYDAPSFEGADSVAAGSEFALGWNAGAGAAFLASRRLALGVEARFASVRPSPAASGLAPFQLEAGGLALLARATVRLF